MPEVARIDGIRIMFYNDEHPPRHVHAQYGEYLALIGLDDLEMIAGWLPKAQYRKVRQWAEPRRSPSRVGSVATGSQSGKDSMTGDAKKSKKILPRIKHAELVLHGVLKICWRDNYEGLVDLRPVIARGHIFTPLQNAKRFPKFEIDEFGHSLGWSLSDGTTIDFSSSNLRERAERQAAILQLAS